MNSSLLYEIYLYVANKERKTAAVKRQSYEEASLLRDIERELSINIANILYYPYKSTHEVEKQIDKYLIENYKISISSVTSKQLLREINLKEIFENEWKR